MGGARCRFGSHSDLTAPAMETDEDRLLESMRATLATGTDVSTDPSDLGRAAAVCGRSAPLLGSATGGSCAMAWRVARAEGAYIINGQQSPT